MLFRSVQIVRQRTGCRRQLGFHSDQSKSPLCAPAHPETGFFAVFGVMGGIEPPACLDLQSIIGASREPHRSTSVSRTEVLRRGSREARGRVGWRVGGIGCQRLGCLRSRPGFGGALRRETPATCKTSTGRACSNHPWLLDHPKAAESPLVRVFELFAGTSIDQKGAVIAQDLKLLEPILWVDDKGFGVIVVEVIDLQRYRFGAGSSPPIKLEVAPAMQIGRAHV